jgi:Tfp pilus assembly protein PilN
MPSINMIAPRRAEKRRMERDMRRLVLVIVGELVCAVALGGWVCTKVVTTHQQIRAYNAQLAQLEPKVKEIEENENATKALKPKMDLLNAAKDGTMRWYNTLDRLTQTMPQSTYLTKLCTTAKTEKGGPIAFDMTGVSVSQARIGEAMLRLAQIPELEKVDLHFTQSANIGKADAIEFEIGATMKGAEQPKGATRNGRVQS